MKISILMPTYNGATVLDRSLEAIVANCLLLQENNIGFEFILSDDCSSDNTFFKAKSILKRYSGLFKSIKLINQPANLGLYNNYRFLLYEASNQLVCFPAQDDNWHPQKLLLEYDKLINSNAVCSYSFANIFHEGTHHPFKSEMFPMAGSGKSPRDRLLNTLTIRGSNPIHGLFLKDSLLSINAFPQQQGGDMITLCLLSTKGNFACTNKFLFSKYEPLDKNTKSLHFSKIVLNSLVGNTPFIKSIHFTITILTIRLRISTNMHTTVCDILFLLKFYTPGILHSLLVSICPSFVKSNSHKQA